MPWFLLYPLIGAALGVGTQAARGKTDNKSLWKGAGLGAGAGLGGGYLAPAAAGGAGGFSALMGSGAGAGGTAGAAKTGATLGTIGKQAAVQTAMQGALQGGMASMQPDTTSTNPQDPGVMQAAPDSVAMMQELLAKRRQPSFNFLPQ